MATKKHNNNLGKAVGIGAGVAALGAAAYILFGPDGKKNQKKIKGWVVKMKGEIIEKLEDVKELTEPVYQQIVQEVTEKYKEHKNATAEEIKAVVADLHRNWRSMVRDSKSAGNKAKRTVKGGAKKAVSKAKSGAKKVARKATRGK